MMTALVALLNRLGIASSSLTPFIHYDTGMSFLLSTDGANALPTWHALRQVTASSGFWPVLLGDLASYREHEHFLQQILLGSELDRIPVTGSITASLAADPLAWFRLQAQRLDRRSGSLSAAEEPALVVEDPRSVQALPPPAWRLHSDPYMYERNTFSIPTEVIYPQPEDAEPVLRIQPAPTVYLALLPTQTTWHIPAYLASGAGNDRLSGEEQLLVWRWWNSRYSAEIVGVTRTTIEAWVVAPPINLQQSERLGWEQHVYCPDVSTLANDLPTDLIDAFVWQFWWD